jgi:transcriptional regulator with XRE-family HTH domain
MDSRNEIRDFLISRRARITPEQAGLPVYGGNRRVSGLRREEVAMLAGVSVDYYIRMERGNARGVSDSVLDNLARALHLDEAERAHLYDLVRAANPGPRAHRRPARQQAPPSPPTWPGSFSSTRPRGRSTRNGISRPATPSRCCGPRPGVTRPTGVCPT